jgi:hypothetical protein
VILSGPLTQMNSLGLDDIYASLDINGLQPGDYTIAPNVIGPGQIRAEGILPETVEVSITSLLTATTAAPGSGTIPAPPELPETSSATPAPQSTLTSSPVSPSLPPATPSATTTVVTPQP